MRLTALATFACVVGSAGAHMNGGHRMGDHMVPPPDYEKQNEITNAEAALKAKFFTMLSVCHDDYESYCGNGASSFVEQAMPSSSESSDSSDSSSSSSDESYDSADQPIFVKDMLMEYEDNKSADSVNGRGLLVFWDSSSSDSSDSSSSSDSGEGWFGRGSARRGPFEGHSGFGNEAGRMCMRKNFYKLNDACQGALYDVMRATTLADHAHGWFGDPMDHHDHPIVGLVVLLLALVGLLRVGKKVSKCCSNAYRRRSRDRQVRLENGHIVDANSESAGLMMMSNSGEPVVVGVPVQYHVA